MENKDPIKPPLSLLVKLGSLVVHYQEFRSGGGHKFDLVTIQSLEKDEEIIQWFDQMNQLALLPLKR